MDPVSGLADHLELYQTIKMQPESPPQSQQPYGVSIEEMPLQLNEMIELDAPAEMIGLGVQDGQEQEIVLPIAHDDLEIPPVEIKDGTCGGTNDFAEALEELMMDLATHNNVDGGGSLQSPDCFTSPELMGGATRGMTTRKRHFDMLDLGEAFEEEIGRKRERSNGPGGEYTSEMSDRGNVKVRRDTQESPNILKSNKHEIRSQSNPANGTDDVVEQGSGSAVNARTDQMQRRAIDLKQIEEIRSCCKEICAVLEQTKLSRLACRAGTRTHKDEGHCRLLTCDDDKSMTDSTRRGNDPEANAEKDPEEVLLTVGEYEGYTYQAVLVKNPILCTLCNKSFRDRKSVSRHHKSKHTPPKKVHRGRSEGFECMKCSKQFKNEVNLRRHITKVHGGAPTHVCLRCGATFASGHAYVTHRRDVHAVAPKSVRKRGRRVERDLVLWRCATCASDKASKGNVRRHIRIVHMGLRPFVCELCGSGWKTKHNLECHVSAKHPHARKMDDNGD